MRDELTPPALKRACPSPSSMLYKKLTDDCVMDNVAVNNISPSGLCQCYSFVVVCLFNLWGEVCAPGGVSACDSPGGFPVGLPAFESSMLLLGTAPHRC